MKDIKRKLSELKELALKNRLNIADEIRQLESKLSNDSNHSNSAWSKVKLSRLIDRPTTLDYIDAIFDDFIDSTATGTSATIRPWSGASGF